MHNHLVVCFLERIIRDYTLFVYARQRNSATSSDPGEPPPPKKAASVTSASSLFGHYSKEVPPARSVTGSALLRQYLTDDTMSTPFDTRYTELRPYFECIFCIPTTSTPVERIFSQSGLIMRPNRSKMTDSLVESLMFLKSN